MHLETLLDQPDFSLPAVNPVAADPFVVFAEQRIEAYIRGVSASAGDLFTNSPPQILNFREFEETVTEFGRGLIQVIRLNSTMNAHEAYPAFKALMDKVGFMISGYPAALFPLNHKQCFFRCKSFPGEAKKTPDWFFHTAFQLAALVGPTRFTPAGIPALYLTNALAVGYQELRAATLDGFQAVKFQTKTKHRRFLLDLDYTRPRPELRHTDREEYDLQLQFKGLLYPLLLCCFTQRNGGAAAPQEYVIPQFLLRWISQSAFYTGIKFPSTRAVGAHYQGSFYNLVIPPVKITDSGFCAELKDLFLMSEVCAYQDDAAAIQQNYDDHFLAPVNQQVTSIDWNGLLEIYDTGELGKMEFLLKNSAVTDVPL